MLVKLKRKGRKKNSPDRRGASCDSAGRELSRPWDGREKLLARV